MKKILQATAALMLMMVLLGNRKTLAGQVYSQVRPLAYHW